MKRFLGALLFALASLLPALAQTAPASEQPEADYLRTITERADKILRTLELTNASSASAVQRAIIQQYRNLREIHDARDAAVQAAKAKFPGDKTAAETAVTRILSEAHARLDNLHASYIASLQSQLTPQQLDKVKDGMTYGVVQVTYNAYLKMFPDLTSEQKSRIMNWLTEAREQAMDEGSSNEKHAVFGRYKGKINNYLSAAGYNLKEGEKNLKK